MWQFHVSLILKGMICFFIAEVLVLPFCNPVHSQPAALTNTPAACSDCQTPSAQIPVDMNLSNG